MRASISSPGVSWPILVSCSEWRLEEPGTPTHDPAAGQMQHIKRWAVGGGWLRWVLGAVGEVGGAGGCAQSRWQGQATS